MASCLLVSAYFILSLCLVGFTLDVRGNRTFANAAAAEVRIDRGNTALLKGYYDKAIEEFTEAIRLKPHHSAAYFGRGVALRGPRRISCNFVSSIGISVRWCNSIGGRYHA